MDFVIIFVLTVATVFCSYKLAIEKQQHKIVWPVVTALVGPSVFIIQYLSTIVSKKKQFN